LPLLTFKRTLERWGSLVPGAGFWEITRPFFTFEENDRLTLPTEQRAFLIVLLATRSVLPFTFGTMQSRRKVAVTEWFPLMVNAQAPVPEHTPDQPVNLDLEDAVAVNVTAVPWSKACVQAVPQLIPAGLDVTVPVPRPALATASVFAGRLKVAVTD